MSKRFVCELTVFNFKNTLVLQHSFYFIITIKSGYDLRSKFYCSWIQSSNKQHSRTDLFLLMKSECGVKEDRVQTERGAYLLKFGFHHWRYIFYLLPVPYKPCPLQLPSTKVMLLHCLLNQANTYYISDFNDVLVKAEYLFVRKTWKNLLG